MCRGCFQNKQNWDFFLVPLLLIMLWSVLFTFYSGPRESRSRSWRSPIKIPENCDLGPGEPQSRPRRTPIKDLENSDQGPGELWSRTRRTSFRAPLGLPRPVCSDREQNNHNGHTSVCVASFWAKHAKVLDLLFKQQKMIRSAKWVICCYGKYDYCCFLKKVSGFSCNEMIKEWYWFGRPGEGLTNVTMGHKP